jgi:hypothetical protein
LHWQEEHISPAKDIQREYTGLGFGKPIRHQVKPCGQRAEEKALKYRSKQQKKKEKHRGR